MPEKKQQDEDPKVDELWRQYRKSQIERAYRSRVFRWFVRMGTLATGMTAAYHLLKAWGWLP